MVWKQLWGARVPTSSSWESKQHPWGERVQEAVFLRQPVLKSPSRGGVKSGQ